jgi:hypothetical protein
MEWRGYINKYIFCKSKQGVYSGILLDFDKPFLIIFDKFSNKVLINESEILKLVEEEMPNDFPIQNLKVLPSGITKTESST